MKKINSTLLLFVAVLVVANLVSERYFFRIDLTEDKQYTLSAVTKDIMGSLEDPITVKAYFSEDLPPNISKTKKDFEEYLIEYARFSDDNLVYKFINPNENKEKEREALKAGVQPVMINVRKKDQMKQQKAFLGAVLEFGDQREVIPFIQPGAALEYALSSSIKKMVVPDKPSIGIIQGQGEPKAEEMQQAITELKVLYHVDFLQLNDSVTIPDNIKTLALIRPKDSIPAGVLKQLDSFLENGGNLFVALNRVQADLNRSYGSAVNTGLETWLRDKGIEVRANFVTDIQCGAVTVQQQQGFFRFNTNVSFPFLPIISKFSDHPVTKGLEAVMLQFASPIVYHEKDSLSVFTPIAFSSANSGSLTAPQYFDIQKKWTKNDYPLKNQVVAAILEQTYKNGKHSRILVVGDGDFPVSPPGQSQQKDNINLMVNAIDWLGDDTGLVDLRTKGIRYRPIEELKDVTKVVLKYVNFLLPILLVTLYGLIRMQRNRNKRIKRMEENYE